jgi:hypothetical protein
MPLKKQKDSVAKRRKSESPGDPVKTIDYTTPVANVGSMPPVEMGSSMTMPSRPTEPISMPAPAIPEVPAPPPAQVLPLLQHLAQLLP